MYSQRCLRRAQHTGLLQSAHQHLSRRTTPNPTSILKPLAASMSNQHGGSSDESLRRLAARLPKGTWDTHMHVVDPHTFPLAKTAQYTPSPHTVQNAKTFLTDRLNISKMVIVQPSIYGNDNACTLDGLAQLGPSNGRAVIQFDPAATSPAQLQSWHDLGVRGVRLNFKSVGAAVSGASLATSLHAYADAVTQFKGTWVLELYIGMEDLPLLEHLVPDLGRGVKLCIDHFAHPSAASLQKAQSVDELPGFSSLVNLLTKRDNVWVKCSAGYRLDPDPRNPLVRSLMREVFRARPDRCVFATDWPHTRFEGVYLAGHLEALLECAEAEGCDLERFCVRNAEELFDAKTT